MMRAAGVLACLWVLFAAALANDARWTSQRDIFALSYQSELNPLQINTLHGWILHIEDASGQPVLGATIEATGGMPAHDHGLPTRPRVTTEIGDGDYRLDGLRFHMGGTWEITFNISANGKSDIVVVTVTL